MYTGNSQTGQSLIEIIFAIAIFTIGVVTIGYLIIDAKTSLRYATDLTQARLLAAEGIEALASIRTGGFDLIPAGIHGLVIEQGVWELVPSADQQGKFTRTITIEDVDVDNKIVTSLVTWDVGGKEKSVIYSTRFSNWMQTGGEAGDLEVITSGATVSATGTALQGLSINNGGNDDIVITKMTVTWDAPVQLEQLTIEGIDVFNASTSTPVASGEEIDIVNYQVGAYSVSHSIDEMFFDGDISNTNFVIRFTFQDETVRSVYVTL